MSCTLLKPNGFADHYPVFKWLFHWEYTQHFQTNPYFPLLLVPGFSILYLRFSILAPGVLILEFGSSILHFAACQASPHFIWSS